MSTDGPVPATGRLGDGVWHGGGTLLDAALLALVVVVATWALVALASRLGLVDDARDAPERKRHRRPVPLVGGVALALALGAWGLSSGGDVFDGPGIGGVTFATGAVWLACAAAFLTGLVDDLAPRGLGPLAKLTGQTVAGVLLARGLEIDGAEAGGLARALAVVVAVAAQNAANAFDNADGALCGVAATCALLHGPLGVAFAAFLPFNLPARAFARTTEPSAVRTPRAWLGDSGSHLVGIALLATPVACGALVLPLLDFARVVGLRLAAGDPPWRGDRRHLAHALQDRGLAPGAVVFVLAVLALPAALALALVFGHA